MDVISLSVDVDRQKIDSRFRLAIAAAKRAKQLNDGAVPTKKTKAKKIVTLALEEVASGTVDVLSGEEAAIAQEKADQSASPGLIDEAGHKQTEIEDTTAIENHLRRYSKEKRESKKEFFPWEEY